MRASIPFLVGLVCLSACVPFPQLDAAGPDTATPPQLLPIDDLLAQAEPQAPDPGPAVFARAERLKARAAAISADPTVP
jgi:hypothetical protein